MRGRGKGQLEKSGGETACCRGEPEPSGARRDLSWSSRGNRRNEGHTGEEPGEQAVGAGLGSRGGEQGLWGGPLRGARTATCVSCFSHRGRGPGLQKNRGDPVPGGLLGGAGAALRGGLRPPRLAEAAAGHVSAHPPPLDLLLVPPLQLPEPRPVRPRADPPRPGVPPPYPAGLS